MIELVIVYCLSASPAHCVERRDPLTDYPSPEACAARAEIVAQEYLAAHPQWRLSHWQCDIDQPRQDPA